MSNSTDQNTSFDLAVEIKSISIRAFIRKDDKITMYVMDPMNRNEVIAFIICDITPGKLHCLDREKRTVFKADCGAGFDNKKNIILRDKLDRERSSPSGVIKYLNDEGYIMENPILHPNDSNCQLKIAHKRKEKHVVYTATNKRLEEVCIMRATRKTMNITYFQSMNDDGRLLLLAFSAKRLLIIYDVRAMKLPKTSILTMLSNPVLSATQNENELSHGEASLTKLLSCLSSIKVAVFQGAGYNKMLGIQYYDVFDGDTGITQLTFEVTLENERNIIAILKDCRGTAIMTVCRLLNDLTVTLISKQTFTTRGTSNKDETQIYDEDGKLFLAAKASVQLSRSLGTRYQCSFFHSENKERKEPVLAWIKSKGLEDVYVMFKDLNLDASKKALILAFAIRDSLLEFNSQTVVTPPIGYCYREGC